MKKVSLAAFLASALMLNTPVAQADSTVKGQKAAYPATAAAAAAPAASTSGGHHSPTAELIARPGNHRSIFELDFMVPVYQMMDRMLFVDLRGQLDTKRNKELNIGLGYRQIIHNSFVLGGYVYGDWRRTRNHNNFWQVTLGAEALSIANLIDVRVNGYLPEKKRKSVKGPGTATVVGNNIQLQRTAEEALPGFDGEVGVRIPMPGMNHVETRIFAGGYYFSRSGARKVAGPRGRFEVRINDIINPGSRLTLGIDVMNDKVRKTNVFGFIGLRVPMQFMGGGKAPQGLQRRLGDYVYRDVDIIAEKVQLNNGFAVNSAGQTQNIYFVKGGTTFANPNAQIGNEVATVNAGTTLAKQAEDIVYVEFNGTTAVVNTADTVTQAANVQILGGGANVTVRDAAGNQYVLYTGNATQRSLVTGFSGGAAGGNFGTLGGTSGGLNMVVPDAATATGVIANITTANNVVNVSNNTITAANPGATINTPYGVSITSATGGSGTVNYTNNTITGFGPNANQAGAFNEVTGTGVLTVNSSGNTFGSALASNTVGFANVLYGSGTTSSLTVNDTNSFYANNSATSFLAQSGGFGGGAGAGSLTATVTNPTITQTTGIGIKFSNGQTAGVVPTILKGSVVGGKITSTGVGAPAAIALITNAQTVAGSTATFSTAANGSNNLIITGNGTGGTSTGIQIQPVNASQGTVISTVSNVTFSGNQGSANANPLLALGANITVGDTIAPGVAVTTTISNNVFTDAGVANTYSVLVNRNVNNTSTSTVSFTGNKMTNTTATMFGFYLGLTALPASLNSLVLSGFSNNTMTGYLSGFAIQNGGSAPGVANLTFATSGNSVTGAPALGFNFNRVAGAGNIIINTVLNPSAAVLSGNAGPSPANLGSQFGVQTQYQ